MLGGQQHDDMDPSPVRWAGTGAGGAGGLWLVVLAALVVAGVWGARRFSGPDAAVAAGPGKPLMLMFTADWCGPCHAFKAGVLSNPAVLDRLGRDCRFQTVDLTHWEGRNRDVAKYYGVDSIPTLMFVDASGHEISRYDGPHDPQFFGRWIDQYAR